MNNEKIRVQKETTTFNENCRFFLVQLMGLEPIRECSHYPLKVARLPIPPQLHIPYLQNEQ